MKKINGLMYLLLSLLLLFTTGCPPFPVIISSPHNGAHFEVGEEITFAGSAKDFKDGELIGDSLVWASVVNNNNRDNNKYIKPFIFFIIFPPLN